METNLDELKKKLSELYRNYLAQPNNEEIKKQARDLYNKYRELYPLVEPEMALAINKLVDIGFNTGIEVSPKDIREILKNLQK